MSLHYKLLAIDVDGTLVNSRNELPDSHRTALHRAHEAGLVVCLCTGRSLAETRHVIDALGLDLDAGIFVFGAIVSDLQRKVTLCRTALSAETSHRVVTHFQAEGNPVLLLYDAADAGVEYVLVEGTRNAEAYERWTEVSPMRVERVASWSYDTFALAPVRIGIIESPAHIAETTRKLADSFSGDELKFNSIYAANYGLHVVECFEPTVNKWQGIRRVAERLQIRLSEVVAVGDDVNDFEMISQAGLGVATANANERIKAVAHEIVPSNDDGGVAVLVDRLLMGKTVPSAGE